MGLLKLPDGVLQKWMTVSHMISLKLKNVTKIEYGCSTANSPT